ncbi:FAD-dependent oxidoreductase [Nitrosococcus watsonii]|uniref:FAD-dependent pyridine nucleotide-disulfide oxidoreductase n=1 Tax=Nitrosococcus watsoni (strain C-113) TaxID=105559 RepID=D8K7M6_NITWC|nr:bifunctional TVP38/TMEM64 family protein/FAD-dependent oxidoreductase [Nitrosococcus watsonii]ADJ28903.1 FAD-dependent pyridine nucleotide-disulfide oxidoreductase [Nitrosococcus watsonii C-113]
MFSIKRLIFIFLILTLIGAFFHFGGPQYLDLERLKAHQEQLQQMIAGAPVVSVSIFFISYVLVAALSLPGAAVMTIAGGALFGLTAGTVIVSFASTLGATLAFLSSRFLFRDSLRQRYDKTVQRVDERIAVDGPFYLASLRLVPVFPFFVINIVMGLTGIPIWRFYWVSQLTMLPGTLVYVNAGTQLAAIQKVGDILSLPLLLSFLLLALFPLIAKFLLALFKRARLYKRFTKPKHFDYNLLVIGAGSAGLVSAYMGATVKAKVALIERDKMGGDCLNTGCIPSKALIKSSRIAEAMRQADRYGLPANNPPIPFAPVMERVQKIIKQIEPHDSVERYTRLGVNCLQGEARLISPWEVEIKAANGSTRRVTTKATIIATGGHPFVPSIEGMGEIRPLTSDTVWQLRKLPQRLLVLGGGPIGCELAQAFARLGSQVTLVEMGERLLLQEDPDASAAILECFREEGITVKLRHKAIRFAIEGGEKVAYCAHPEGELRISFDQVLVAVGRTANTEHLGLENLGLSTSKGGALPVEEDMSVGYPNLFACGDVTGLYQFTHVAAHQAWFAAVNALFGHFKRFKVDYSVIPWVTFTSPEVGRVGLNEIEAKKQGMDYEVTRYGLKDLDRAIAESEAYGYIKVLTPPGKDRILGVTVVAPHGAELLAEFILAMKHKIGLNKILGTIHPYPTWNEAVKFTAGEWKKAHAPEKILRWLERFHRWRLG